MDAFQTNLATTILCLLLPLIFAAVSFGLSGFGQHTRERPSGFRSVHLLSLVIGLTLFLFAVLILVTAPPYDFIDRCRPSGSALCVDGRTIDQVRQEIRLDKAKAIAIYLVVPILLPSIIFQVARRFFFPRRGQVM